MLNYSAIPVIVVICYVVVTAIKSTKVNSKWYPLISCTLGALLAAAMFFILPEFIGAATLTAAIISGAVSGLAATGTNQVFKQLLKAAENGEDLSKVNTTSTTPTDTGGSTDTKYNGVFSHFRSEILRLRLRMTGFLNSPKSCRKANHDELGLRP